MKPGDLLSALPVREGHFTTESGYHTNLWFSLDALFVCPRALAPLITTLAGRLRPYDSSIICGPLVGGAFVAQALAMELGLDFCFAEPVPPAVGAGLVQAEDRVPDGLKAAVRGARVALVDDVISAGSSVRATALALAEAGASVVVIGTLMTLGSIGLDHFADTGVPIEAVLGGRDFAMWTPDACPLCRSGTPLQSPS
jgi:orotate phosphoribosyltransferase